MSRSRGYAFTINNWNDDDLEAVKALSEDANYIICGKEIGKEGTPHLQGYVLFKSQRHFTAVKKCLPRAHLEVAKGNAMQNTKYCEKDGNLAYSFGECPKQGKRTDVEEIREHMQEGGNMRSAVLAARSYQAIKVAEVYLKYHEEPRKWKPEVRWFHGSTGAGKTKAAREWLGDDCYTALETAKWFEGYDGHENVLFDDFRKDFCKFHTLLKILDRYEFRVETKGGSRQFLARKIALTSPFHPADLYNTREDVQQLLRRIDQIIQIGDKVSLLPEDGF